MKICIYALHLGCGGVENYVATIANILSAENEVEIISTYKAAPSPAFHISERVKVRYLINDCPNKYGRGYPLRFIHLARLFIEKYAKNLSSVRGCDADVIISTRIFHNRFIGRFAKKEAFKITGEHNHHNGNKAYIRRVVSSCRGFDLFAPISKELCDFYKPLLQVRGVEVIHIPFCVSAQSHVEEKREKHLIYAGRFSREKGVPDTISVFERLLADSPHAHLHLIGDGEERRIIEKYIADKGLGDHITLYGCRSKDFVLQLMKKCSVYIMTSHTESFGIALLEAMSCGLFCVAFSDARGAGEIIRHGYNGYIVSDRRCDEMARVIRDTLDSPEKSKELSLNARRTAEDYSPEKTSLGWHKVLNRIDASKKSQSAPSLDGKLKKAFTD